jgi:hypothetical protein
VDFAAFKHERTVNLLEFEVSGYQVLRNNIGWRSTGLLQHESRDCSLHALVDVGLDKHLDEITIGHDVPNTALAAEWNK